jgi:hypothetical protein
MTPVRRRSLACIATLATALSKSATAGVVINEVRSRPAGMEFLELYNSGTSPVDLSGWSLGPAIQFTFPRGVSMEPGEYLVIAQAPDVLQARGPAIPEGVRVFGWENGELSAGGPLRLLDPEAGVQSAVDEAAYAAGRPGSSSELLNPSLPPGSARAWQASVTAGGTPGARNSRFRSGPIVLAETPERGSRATGLGRISVLFSEKVRHVYASDLKVDGHPSRSVTGNGAGPYVFDVQPPAGAEATVSLGVAGSIEGERGVAFASDSWQYFAPTTILSLPDNAQGGPGANVQVPISAAPADGINSIDLTIQYDAAVIQAVGVTTSGLGLAAGFSTFANTSNPGEVIVSTFSNTGPMSGSGEFARIQFHVVGTPGATSPLAFAAYSVDEGSTPSSVDPGTFTVTCAGVSNGTPCSDGNSCTVGDSCQAGACAAGSPAPPPIEIQGMSIAGDKASISWAAAAGSGVQYDVVRGVVSQLPAGGGASETCVASGTSATTIADAATPALLTSFWYLSRARTTCGAGTYGFMEVNGVPTAQRNPTACP